MRKTTPAFLLFFINIFSLLLASAQAHGEKRIPHILSSSTEGGAQNESARHASNPEPPKMRIVSLAPVVTETLFALGIGDHVVGVTRFCDRPAAASAIEKVGGYIDPQIEKILSLKPTLVIAMPSMGQREKLNILKERNIPVAVVFGDTIQEILESFTFIGGLVHREEAANHLIARTRHRLDKVRHQAKISQHRPRTLVVVSVQPLVIAGPGTFAHEAIEIAGGTPAYTKGTQQWPTLSLESLLSLKIDAIIAAEGPAQAELLRQQLAAHGSNRTQVVAAQTHLFMRPGPTLTDDIETLFSLLHNNHRQTP